MSQRDTTGEYVLGTDEIERQRLGLQHRLWSAAAHDLWERISLRPGMTVLDLGCGPGFTTCDLARIVGPTGRVIGIDASPGFVEHVNRQAHTRDMPWMSARTGDVTRLAEALHDLPAASLDAIYGRWVLCFVDNPEAVVRDAARALRPGGILALQEYFNYGAMSLAPRDEAFTAVVTAVMASWRARGGDPDIAGRLPEMMARAGLSVGRITAHARTARSGEMLWAWPDSFWPSVVPRLVTGGFLTQDQASAFFTAWERARADAGAWVALPTVYDCVGTRP